jgi:RNA recognition motif-containing protein
LTDEFKEFFSKFGKVVEHEIIRDHATNRSRGFGFIVFDAEKTVDELLAKKGNMIDLNGSQVRFRVVPSELCKSSFVQLGLHRVINFGSLVNSKSAHTIAYFVSLASVALLYE